MTLIICYGSHSSLLFINVCTFNVYHMAEIQFLKSILSFSNRSMPMYFPIPSFIFALIHSSSFAAWKSKNVDKTLHNYHKT